MSLRGAKPKAVEELVDFYFHRRLAFPLVGLAARIGITPNQITWLSLGIGLVSAALFYRGQFAWASCAMFVAILLDCSDGMLARITGTSSPLGRAMDGTFDAVWIVLVWCGLYFSGHYSLPHGLTLPFMAVSGICMPLHCWTYDGIKTTYVALCEPNFSEKTLSKAEALGLSLESRARGRVFEALLYRVMAYQAAGFAPKPVHRRDLKPQDREAARETLRPAMRLWSFLGEGTHLALLYGAGILTPLFPNAILVVCAVILVPMNLLWLIAAISWSRAKKRVLTLVPSPS